MQKHRNFTFYISLVFIKFFVVFLDLQTCEEWNKEDGAGGGG